MVRPAIVVLGALALPWLTPAALADGVGDGPVAASTRPADADSTRIADAASARIADAAPRPIIGFVVMGNSKVTNETLAFLSRMRIGDPVTAAQIPELQRAVMSSELFKSVEILLVERDEGVIVVADVDDKHSWIVMPTVYLLSSAKSVGFGFADNNLFGENRKFLIYGQLGTVDSFFACAYVIPTFRGTRLSLMFDTFWQRARFAEYSNPAGDAASLELARRSTYLFFNGGVSAGWNFRWWLNTDVRLRGAYVSYDDAQVPDEPTMPLPDPSPSGRDITAQLRLTIDARTRLWGIAAGPYLQARAELALPGVSDYDYYSIHVRAAYAWKFLEAHSLELRTVTSLGYHLPFHDEWVLGAASDLRGYQSEQFRGDTRLFARAEYSVPITRIKMLQLRGVGFYDAGYIGFHQTSPAVRDYLPGQIGEGVFRSDVGAGFRVYVRSVVLPLLGFDIGYGLESRAPAFYFQIGLTDF